MLLRLELPVPGVPLLARPLHEHRRLLQLYARRHRRRDAEQRDAE